MAANRVETAINAAKAGDTKAATDILKQVLQENPKDARAWYLLSQVIGDNAKAQECVNKVLEIVPDNQQAKDRLAKLEEEAEKFEELTIPSAPIQLPAPIQPQQAVFVPIVSNDPLENAARKAATIGLTLSSWGVVFVTFGVLLIMGLCLWIFLFSK
jgi:Tfp pilus assembly protein PilF